jgi:predicted RNase H-related nuclease YkuK (DUF458 family)
MNDKNKGNCSLIEVIENLVKKNANEYKITLGSKSEFMNCLKMLGFG